MRCPKCGFISFDHLTSCAKCGRDVSEVASELQGTSIKVENPMFLSGALAAFSESEESFEDHAMEAEVDEGGIDFDMDMEVEEQEAVEAADVEEDIDFSFEDEEKAETLEVADEEEEADISLAEAEAEEAVDVEEEVELLDEAADFELEAEEETEEETKEEVEEEASPEETEESFEELDLMGTADDEDEGGLEFDLEDFLEEDEEK